MAKVIKKPSEADQDKLYAAAIVDHKCLAKATLNGVPVADVLIHKDWHLASYAAQSIVPESAADHTVQLTHPETNETRTFVVKGWYEFKKSAREVRHKRQHLCSANSEWAGHEKLCSVCGAKNVEQE